MSHRIHRRIALIALERGHLDESVMCDAMVALGRLDAVGESGGLGVWFDHGWLDEAQMAEVLAELGLLPEILVHSDETGVLPELDGTQRALQRALGDLTDEMNVDEGRSQSVDSVTRTLMSEPRPNTDQDGARAAGFAEDEPTQSRRINDDGTVDPRRTLAWARTRTDAPTDDATSAEITQIKRLPPTDRYVVGRELGSGGGGRVVRAYDRALGRTVAMKVLRGDSATDSALTARFMAEAQATGQLEHPNIVPIYDFGRLPTDELFYTMREVRRHSLRDALEGIRRGSPHYTSEYTLISLVSILRQVSQAAHYAHVRGVVHRDLKPDNIMVGDYGEVLVMDWGLARILDRPARLNLAEKAPAEQPGHTLGTPAYMPPEQARGELEEVDERSDVYGLGAILYEILSLEPPFVGDGPVDTMWQVVEAELVSPRQRAPDRDCPQELERICLRAMASDKEARYSTARDFAEELEDWIEGLQPREARRRVEAGRRASQMYEELSVRIQQLDERARHVAAAIEGWEPIDEKRELWEIEDQGEQARVERARAFGEAVSAFTQALAYQPQNEDARRGLVNLYWKRLEDARGRNSMVDAVYFEALVRQYDDGRFSRLLDSPAGLELRTNPAGANVILYTVEGVDRRLREAQRRELGETPLEVAELDEASYLLEITLDDRPPLRRPVRLVRGRSEVVDVDIPDVESFTPGFAYIAGGEFIAGGDPDAFDPRSQQRLSIDAFFCAEFPVTFREYLQYVNELWETDEELALERAPQTRAEEGLLVRFDEEAGIWVPDEILIEGPARDMYPVGEGHEEEIPVVGIRYSDALAYCAWRSERDGRTYRLPTGLELEKAGRGVDGRFFPWGNQFDPTFCKMRFSRAELPQLEPVGAFPDDCSPYGVRDLAGGVQEWCRGKDDDLADQPVKGGSWNQDHRAARLASRANILAVARSAGIGMRLVYDP